MHGVLLILLVSSGAAWAQVATSGDCFVDQPGLPFESTFGYQLATAEDGTVFPENERLAFNRLAAMLPDFYKNMSSLQSFRRVANGYYIDDGASGIYHGQMWSNSFQTIYKGSIELCQESTEIADGRFVGDFYVNAVHEMSHAFDWLNHKISASPEWGQLEAQGATQFVTDYAATNAEEDFAESLSHFILDPDLMLKNAPLKYEYLSQKFFGGKKFDTASLTRFYQDVLGPLSAEARIQKMKNLRLNDYYACKVLKLPTSVNP